MQQHLLSLPVWIPILGAWLVAIAPKSATKALAAVTSLAAMIVSIVVAVKYNPSGPKFQLEEHYSWIKSANIEYYLGIDGISVTMVLLTGVLSFICILASWGFEHWNTNKGIKGYFALFLLLEAGMMGVFESLDFFLFYVFWEMMLLPMYFLIGVWGGPRKEYAAINFFLYTLAGSVLMLLALIALYYKSAPTTLVNGAPAEHTFDLMKWSYLDSEVFEKTGWTLLGMNASHLVWIGLFIGFA